MKTTYKIMFTLVMHKVHMYMYILYGYASMQVGLSWQEQMHTRYLLDRLKKETGRREAW